MSFHVSGLPLSLMRSMQSTQFIEEKVTEEGTLPSHLSQRSEKEVDSAVNQRGLTARQSFMEHLVNVDGKLQNQRLNYKLSRISEHTFQYLTHTPTESVKADMQRFSVSGLSERLVKKQALRDKAHKSDVRKSLTYLESIHRHDEKSLHKIEPSTSTELKDEAKKDSPIKMR
jgi:hypothetical protein